MTREEQAKYIAEKLMENPDFRKAFVGAITDAVNEVVKVIKSLQQAPCEDVISRAEALKHSFPIFDDDGVGCIVVRADKIEQLPPVKPTEKVGQWIPVSERLPEFMHHEDEFDGEYYESERVLIYTEDIHEPEYGPVCIAQYEKYHSEGRWVEGWYSEPISSLLSAVAWMPLPEPYNASPTGEDSTCDDCKTPCVMYEKGMRGCNPTGGEVLER